MAVLLQGNRGSVQQLGSREVPVPRVSPHIGGPRAPGQVSSRVWLLGLLGHDGRYFPFPDSVYKAAQEGDGKLQLSGDLQLKIIIFFLPTYRKT